MQLRASQKETSIVEL